MKKNKVILYKESALINSENKFSLLQMNLINLFLRVAKEQYFYQIKKENNFFISNEEIKKQISANKVNITSAINLINIIKNTWFRVNLNQKDKYGIWPDNFSFIQGFSVVSNGINFELSNSLYEIIKTINDKKQQIPFAILDLNITKKFSSKYSLILYEFMCDYANAPSLPTMNIEELKIRLGITNKYPQFSNINKKINKAIKEIEDLTGITIATKIKRKKLKPAAIKFEIVKKDNVNSVHVTDNNTFNQKDEENQEVNLIDMTDNHSEHVHVTESNTFNQKDEENQKVKEKNITESKVNSVYLTESHIFNQKAKENQEFIKKWTPTPELKEWAEKFIIEHPNLPLEQIEKIKKRYL